MQIQPIYFNTPDLIIKVITIILFAGWQLYWRIMGNISDKVKPKTKEMDWFRYLRMGATWFFGSFLAFQLIGFHIFSFQYNILVQLIGFVMVITGIAVSCTARVTLKHNWTSAYEYQIKKNHELIDYGIYSYIRHPIYTGLTLAYTGGELILCSYLFIPMFLTLIIMGYIQAKQEEALLKSHFGKKYVDYMKKTKMFYPFIF